MASHDSHYMKHLKKYYDKNTIKKVLNDKKVLGIQSYPHYVNAFIKNHKNEFKDDMNSVEKAVLDIEEGWIDMAFDDIFSGFEGLSEEKEDGDSAAESTAEAAVVPEPAAVEPVKSAAAESTAVKPEPEPVAEEETESEEEQPAPRRSVVQQQVQQPPAPDNFQNTPEYKLNKKITEEFKKYKHLFKGFSFKRMDRPQ